MDLKVTPLTARAHRHLPCNFGRGAGRAAPQLRENAAWALGELAGMNVGGKESLPLLIDLLGDGETQTRGMAAWALGRLAERMGLVDEASVERLRSLRADHSQYVSKTADWTLERILPLLAKPPSEV